MVYCVMYVLIFFFCSIMPTSLSAFVYQITVMRIPKSTVGSYYYFIGCSDFHDDCYKQALEQREQLVSILTKANRLHTHVVLEDLNSPNVQGRQGCRNFMLASKKGILAGLTQDLQKNGCGAENVEYRFARVIALSELLRGLESNIRSNPFNYAAACGLRIGDILHELDETIQEIRSYDDGVLCNSLYADGCEKIKRRVDYFKFLQQKEKSIATFCIDNSTIDNRSIFLKQLLTFDTDLLDFKMVHAILGAQDKQCSVVIAGGMHIAHIVALLEQIGFTHVDFAGSNQLFDQLQPVSLALLQKYID